jgi:hypothetical protein
MESLQVLSIHDRARPVLAFELKDTLRALQPMLERWRWFIYGLETMNPLPVAEQAEGSWLSSSDLTRVAGDIVQTIEGTFIAFPLSLDGIALLECTRAAFPTSRAELMVIALDSSCFEIYAKDPQVRNLLKQHFHDVRDENAQSYF